MIEPCRVNKKERVTFGFYDYRPFRRRGYGKPENFQRTCESFHDGKSNMNQPHPSSVEIKERVEE